MKNQFVKILAALSLEDPYRKTVAGFLLWIAAAAAAWAAGGSFGTAVAVAIAGPCFFLALIFCVLCVVFAIVGDKFWQLAFPIVGYALFAFAGFALMYWVANVTWFVVGATALSAFALYPFGTGLGDLLQYRR